MAGEWSVADAITTYVVDWMITAIANGMHGFRAKEVGWRTMWSRPGYS